MLSSLLVFFLYVLSTTSLAVTASPLPQSINGSTVELEGRAPPKKDNKADRNAQPDYLKNVQLQLGFQNEGKEDELWGLILVGASGSKGNSCLFLRDGKLVSGIPSECQTNKWTNVMPLGASVTFPKISFKTTLFEGVRQQFTPRPQCEYGGPLPAHVSSAKLPALIKPMSSSDFHGAISPDAIRFALKYFKEREVYTGEQEIPKVFRTMYEEKYRRVYEQRCGKTKEGKEVLEFLSKT